MNGSFHIMIAEDEPNVRLVFRTALASDRCTVSTAPDGETALRWLKQEPTDLLLLDLRMPGMGGIEVLRRLRESAVEVPVVIVSAHDQTSIVVQAMRLGAIDFLPKPTTPEGLRRVVDEVLSRRPKPARPAKSGSVAPAYDAATDPLKRAKDAFTRRSFGEAEVSLREAIARNSRCAEGHYLLGVLHELRDERQMAYSDYRAALLADPAFEPAKLHLMKYVDYNNISIIYI